MDCPVITKMQAIHRLSKLNAGDGGGIQTLDISKLKFVVKSEWAIERAMLDLLGQHLGVPMCQLLGEGQQRREADVPGYLFYVSGSHDRDDAMAMQYLIPGWKYDHKKPCLVR